MPWFKVDDGFWSHPKVIELEPSSVALWVRAGSYCAQHLTDGFISRSVVRILGHLPSDADALVEAGLWDGKPDGKPVGYMFHDWGNYQPPSVATKEKRDELSRKRAEAGRKGAGARWSQEASQTDGNTDGKLPSPVDSKPIAPSRPVPSRPSSTKKEAAASRGTRVDPQFTITTAMREWASKEAPLVNLDAKRGEWVDYWAAVPGVKGLKTDWVATWRNGMRKQQEFAERDRGPAASSTPKRKFVAHAD